jgi:hypothetical protein
MARYSYLIDFIFIRENYLDHGFLSLSTPLLDFRRRFRVDYKPFNPILVHCRFEFSSGLFFRWINRSF